MSGIRVNEWLHNSGTGGIWQTSAGNVGIASSVPTAKLVVTGDVNVSGALTAATYNGGGFANRNLMINGAMNVAQRGTSDTTSGQGFTTVDRWSVVWSGLENVINRYQESLSSSDTGPWEKGFRNAWKIENGDQTGGADANGYINPQYAVEAQDIASSGWNYTDPTSKITLSFWVKSSVAQTFYGYLYTADGTAQAYSFSYALSANTWTKVEKVIPGNSNITINNDKGDGFRIYLPLFLGTDRTASDNTLNTWAAYSSSSRTPDQTTTWYTTNDATWHMTGIQLEVGSVATPFEHRSYSEELLRCQRYLQIITSEDDDNYFGIGYYYNSSQVYLQYRMQPEMRTGPSVVQVTGTDWYYIYRDNAGDSFSGFTGFQWNSGTDNAGRSGSFYNNSEMSGTAGQAGGFYAANNGAKISLDAEL